MFQKSLGDFREFNLQLLSYQETFKSFEALYWLLEEREKLVPALAMALTQMSVRYFNKV